LKLKKFKISDIVQDAELNIFAVLDITTFNPTKGLELNLPYYKTIKLSDKPYGGLRDSSGFYRFGINSPKENEFFIIGVLTELARELYDETF
jgi:hypothetical protein